MSSLDLLRDTKESREYIKGLEPHKETLKQSLFSALKEILQLEQGLYIEWEFGRLFNDGETPYYRVESIYFKREKEEYGISIDLEERFEDSELTEESQDLFLFIKNTYTRNVLSIIFGEDPILIKIDQNGNVKVKKDG